MTSSRPPADRGVDEWKAKNLARVEYRAQQLTVYRSGWLLGPAGLPAAISRYRRGEATPEQVARAYVRSRVAAPEGFVFRDDELGGLVSLVASCSRGPSYPERTRRDALVKAQEDADRRLRQNMQAASAAVTKLPEAIAETADRLRGLVAPVFELLDQNPALKRALLGPTAAPEFGGPPGLVSGSAGASPRGSKAVQGAFALRPIRGSAARRAGTREFRPSRGIVPSFAGPVHGLQRCGRWVRRDAYRIAISQSSCPAQPRAAARSGAAHRAAAA